MTFINSLLQKDNRWFFSKPPLPFRFILIFVNGDGIVIFPFLIILLLVGWFSMRWMFVSLTLFVIFRSLGEMIYWLIQQFIGGRYRPYDFGLRGFSNKAVYIIYQTLALAGCVIGTAGLIYVLNTWFL